MDLITREAAVNAIYKRDERLQRDEIYRNKGDRIDLLGVLPEIHAIPPAFHGMTNGEVFDSIIDVDNDCEEVHGENGLMWFAFSQDWWNSPYKKGE